MTTFSTSEARGWARENFTGVYNVILPSFTRDLSDINRNGIRHDVRRNTELGFRGTLLVAECATTVSEYLDFVRVASDENAGRMVLMHHASFNSLDENIAVLEPVERAGAEMLLLSYPPSFFPTSQEDIYRYTKSICDATSMAVMLFPVPLWGFERLHPAGIEIDTLERLVDDCPNVVAIKAEGGYPSITGFAHTWRRLADRVLVTFPIEQHAIGLAALTGMQVIATSNTEYYGDAVPRMMRYLASDDVESAMDIFWRIAPARKANEAAGAIGAANVVQRMVWKYQAWLAGYNGGPLRMPTSRIAPWQLSSLRDGLRRAGLPVTDDPDEQFVVGRTTP